MKISSWNVNGIRSIYKKKFSKWFFDEKADIVCIQETRANEIQYPEELKKINGYNFYCSSTYKKGYSGVAVWSKIRPDYVTSDIFNKNFDDEGRILKLVFKNIIIFNIYFPNGRLSLDRLKYKIKFYDMIIEYLKKYNNKNVIVCGDYNTAHLPIDLARPKQNKMVSGFMIEEREKINKLISIGFIDSFRYFNKMPENYTWWDYKTFARKRNIGWRIDYFFVSINSINFLRSSCIESDIFGSDHCPISIDIF
ncbi:MAG: exodeoxyribonuclease III [Endomicrobium sp.]|jgi:exodeoxyribonuclease-3|nr:exodeoxyribonuclease III [Endomicrobium sp.]